MPRVLITGVRGKTGVPLAEMLAAREGVEVLGGSSDPASVTQNGVRPTAFSWDDPSGWSRATAGVDAVYLVRPDRADAPELVAALVAEIPREARIVLLSGLDADPDEPAGWSRRVEQVVRDGGHEWTVLRPSWFMQVFADPRFFRSEIEDDGRLAFAGGGATVSWIDARDIAAVAERALLDDGHGGRVHRITGPQALSLPRTAEVLSDALGQPVTHHEVTIEDAVAGMPPGFERDQFVQTLEQVRDGVFADVTDTVERATGRPARPLAELAAP